MRSCQRALYCRELQHTSGKYIYVLIRLAQTNVNHFPLKWNTYKTNNAILYLMVGCSGRSNQVKNNKVKQIKEKYYLEKAEYQLSDFKTFRRTQLHPFRVFPLLFLLHFSFSWGVSRLRSSRQGRLTHSWTTNQPSLPRSAIFINFCLLWIICLASCTKVFTWLGSSALDYE